MHSVLVYLNERKREIWRVREKKNNYRKKIGGRLTRDDQSLRIAKVGKSRIYFFREWITATGTLKGLTPTQGLIYIFDLA